MPSPLFYFIFFDFLLIRTSQGNKAYLLQMPSGMVPLYCHMSSHGLGACGGGGWTLVMKTNGNKVSHDNQQFVVCRNMHINIFLIRIFERIVKTSFVPSRVVRDIWIL